MPDQSALRLTPRHLKGILTDEQLAWFEGTKARTGMRRNTLLRYCVEQAMKGPPPARELPFVRDPNA